MKLDMEVGLDPGHIVLDGDPASPPAKETQPPILAHVCCVQTAGSIKMPLCTEVGVGPGNTVLMGTQQPPLLGPCILWPNGRPSQLVLSSCRDE